MQFPTGRISSGRSRARRFIVGRSSEYYNNSNRVYSNHPDSNSEPNDQEFPTQQPQPQPRFQSQPPRGGDNHYRAVNETNTNIRRNEGYGQRGRRPSYRGTNNTYLNPNSRPNFNAVPYTYQNVNPSTGTGTTQRQIDRPMRAPPPDDHRHWQYALRQPPSQNERFIILSYNILADYLVREHWQKLYKHIPHFMLNWDWRKKRIMLELGLWSPDIMCLQEVDKFQELQQELKERGYGGVFKERTGIARDGCAIFWRTSRFELMHEESIEYSKLGLRDNVAQICVLQSKCISNAQCGANQSENSGQMPGAVNRVVVCNIHVFFNPKRGEVKLGQVRVLFEKALAVSKAWDDAPVVIAGDFNSTPKSPLYDFVSKSELDISGLARNQISGQPGSQPNFRPSSSNRNVPELARLAGTILQSAIGNEVVHKDESTTNSSTLRDSMSEENILKIFTDTSVEWKSVQAEKDSSLAGSKKENILDKAKCSTKTLTDATMGTKVNYENDVDESYVTEQGQYASLNKMKQTSHILSTEETINFAVSTEEGSSLAGGSSEKCCMVMASTGYDPVSVEEDVSAVNVREDQGKRLLDLCSSECIFTQKEMTILSDDVSETDGNLYLHKTVKGDAREELEDSVFFVSEAKKSESTSKCLSSVVGSDTPTQLRADLCPEGVETQDGSVSDENSMEASSSLLCGKNDIGNFSGIERFGDIGSGEEFLLNAQNADAGVLDEEQIVKQSDSSPVCPLENAGLNPSEVLSTLLSGKSSVTEEQEGDIFSLDELMAKSRITDTGGMNIAKIQSDQGLETPNQPSELHLASASDSNTPVEASIIQYDPYSWSPMEIKAATGNADCFSVRHNMRLRSAYTEVEDYAGTKGSDGEPLVTSYNGLFMGTVDYIWCTEGLQTVKVLDTLPKHVLQRTRGFPTKKWGSDHLALACQLAFTSKSSTDEDH